MSIGRLDDPPVGSSQATPEDVSTTAVGVDAQLVQATRDEIKRITEKLEKNLREYVNRDEFPKGPIKDTEEAEPGKFVIKPNPKRGNIMRS